MGITKVKLVNGVYTFDDSGKVRVPTPEEDVRPKCFQHLRPIGGYEWLEMSPQEYNSYGRNFESDRLDESLINENVKYTYVARILALDDCCGSVVELDHADVLSHSFTKAHDDLESWHKLLIIGVVYSTNTVRYIRKFVGDLCNAVLFSNAITNISDKGGSTVKFDYMLPSSYRGNDSHNQLQGYYRTLISLGFTPEYSFLGEEFETPSSKEVECVHAEVVTEKTFKAFQDAVTEMNRANVAKRLIKRSNDILFTISDFRVRNEKVFNCLIAVCIKDELYHDFRHNKLTIDLRDMTFVTELGEGLCSNIMCTDGEAVSSVVSAYVDTRAFTDVAWNNILLPETIKRIDGFVFSSTKQDLLSLPDSIEHIDDYAFYRSEVNLEVSYELDEKLKNAGDEGFYKQVGDVIWK